MEHDVFQRMWWKVRAATRLWLPGVLPAHRCFCADTVAHAS